MSRLQLVRSRPRLTAGTHIESTGVTVHRAARVELSSPGVSTYADGELVAPLPAVAECVPGALHVVGTGRVTIRGGQGGGETGPASVVRAAATTIST